MIQDNGTKGLFEASVWLESINQHPQEFGPIIGSSPSGTQLKGQPKPNGNPYLANCVSYDFGPVGNDGWQVIRSDIFSFIEANAATISKLTRSHGCRAGLTIVCRMTNFHMGLDLTPEDILSLAESRIGLDINVY